MSLSIALMHYVCMMTSVKQISPLNVTSKKQIANLIMHEFLAQQRWKKKIPLWKEHNGARGLRKFSQTTLCVKVYMTDFFICSIKSPQCTDMYSKEKFSIVIFLPRVLMYQKRQISLPVGCKTVRPQTGTGHWEWLWHHFRTASFTKNRFLCQSFSYCELINSLRNGTIVCSL